MITFSKFLATIKIDVPIQLEMDALVREEADENSLRSIFEELEFRTLIDRVLKRYFRKRNNLCHRKQSCYWKSAPLLFHFFPKKEAECKAIYLRISRPMNRVKQKIEPRDVRIAHL